MKRTEVIVDKARRPLELTATLLHFLGMRTLDILTGEPSLAARRAMRRMLPGKAGSPRVERVRLRRARCVENPLDCARCMRSCPEGVFFTYPRKREYGRACGSYQLVVAFASRCTGCGICVEACPKGALSL